MDEIAVNGTTYRIGEKFVGFQCTDWFVPIECRGVIGQIISIGSGGDCVLVKFPMQICADDEWYFPLKHKNNINCLSHPDNLVNKQNNKKEAQPIVASLGNKVEFLTNNERKVEMKKSINQLSGLRVPAYAIIDMKSGYSVEVCEDRATARKYLGEYKRMNKGNVFKILKLAPEKWIR